MAIRNEPDSWKGSPGGLDDAEYLEAIGQCIAEALQLAGSDGIKSIGFPLIGCDLFGLSPGMLIRQFIGTVETAAENSANPIPDSIWLVIRHSDQLARVQQELVSMLFEMRRGRVVAGNLVRAAEFN